MNIRKITLIAYDNTAPEEVCVTLFRAQPLGASESDAVSVCTADSTADPQRVATSAISPRKMNTVNHGPYLWLSTGANVTFYGVQVVYSH